MIYLGHRASHANFSLPLSTQVYRAIALLLQNNPSDSESKEEKGDYRVLGAGPPFLTNNKPKIPKYPKKSEGILKTKQQEQEIEDLGDAKRKEIVGNSIDGAIVESILGKVGS